jgi:DNA-binding CsgD family transcriptional regulator
MVGRDSELGSLESWLAQRRLGAPAVALLSGGGGLGKTRLVDELLARVEPDILVLRATCPASSTAGAPYQAVYRALQERLRFDHPPGGPAPVAGMAAALEQAAARRPVLVVVEDLHWSDQLTRDLLTYLVATVPGAWGLLASYRDDGPLTRADIAALADALERRPVLRITVDPLQPADVAAQWEALSGSRPSPERAAVLHRRSGGIPLLVEELVACGDADVPAHLRAAFVARVRRLGPSMVSLVHALAVSEQPAAEDVVAAVAALGVGTARLQLERGEEAGLVRREPEGFLIRHELLREAVYAEMPPALRRTLHGRVADTIRAGGKAATGTIAHHLYEAGRLTEAAVASMAAADDAAQAQDVVAEHHHLERVLLLWRHVPEADRRTVGGRDEVLRRAARAAERAGAFARAAVLAEERVHESPDDPLRRERVARYRWESGDDAGAAQAFDAAATRLDDETPIDTRLQVLSAYAWFLGATYRAEEARTLSRTARALADGLPSVPWQVLLAFGVARLGTDEGERSLEQALRQAGQRDRPARVAVSTLWLNNSLQVSGDTARRDDLLTNSLASVRLHRLGPGPEQAVRLMLAELRLETGRWDEASTLLDEIRGATGMTGLFAWAFRARLAARRGDLQALDLALSRVRGSAPVATSQPLPLGVAELADAEARLWAGDLGAARRVAVSALRLAGKDAYYGAEAAALVSRARADQRLAGNRVGDGDADGAWPDPPQVVTRGPVPAWHRTTAAEEGRAAGVRDPEAWREVVEAWEDTEDAYALAYARLRYAWALLGDRSERGLARRQLRLAGETATALGAGPLLDAVEGLARRARLRPEKSPGAGHGLTARELEVLPLVVAGQTDPQIAHSLGISPRTVGVHVSSILRKLHATRRTEAADVARRSGLVP